MYMHMHTPTCAHTRALTHAELHIEVVTVLLECVPHVPMRLEMARSLLELVANLVVANFTAGQL